MRSTAQRILLLFALLLSSKALGQWQSHGPYGGTVTCFAFKDSNIFIGTSGGIFRSSNDGINWEQVNNNLPKTYINTLVVIGKYLFAGMNGGVFRSSDNGQSWKTTNTIDPTYHSVKSFAVIDTILFVGNQYGVLRSTDYGTSWVVMSRYSTVKQLAVVDTILFANCQTGLFRSSNYGQNWANLSMPGPFGGVLGVRDSILFAAMTYCDGFFLSTDYGSSWKLQAKDLEAPCTPEVITISEKKIFVGTSNRGVSLSTNDGLSWTAVNLGLTDTTIKALAIRGKKIFTGTMLDGVFLSSNDAADWKSINNGINRTLIYSIAGTNDTIFAGSVGIYRSIDNGMHWDKIKQFPNIQVNSLLIEGKYIFAGTQYHGIFRSEDNGDMWNAIDSGLKFSNISSLLFDHGYLFAGSPYEGICRSSNYGINWISTSNGLQDSIEDTVIYSLASMGESIYAATDSGVYRSSNSGDKWTWSSSGIIDNRVLSVLGHHSLLFAGTEFGGIYRSSDNGDHWIGVDSGLNGLIEKWIPAFVSSGNNIFAAANYGGSVLLSTDDGLSWNSANTGLIDTFSMGVLAATKTDIFCGSNWLFGCGIWRRPLSDFGINDVKVPTQSNLNVSLSPNPTTGIITVRNAPTNIHIAIMDVLGQTVQEFSNSVEGDFSIDLSKQPPGTYFARFSSATEVITRKIIKE